jgi:hypothetical protein
MGLGTAISQGVPRSGIFEMDHGACVLCRHGGVLLKTPDWPAFPVDAKQILYLLDKRYISTADVILDESILFDKNKSDGMVRFITVSQILWFLINCLGRAVQHLAMTTLELTTLGFILCSLGTFLCWAPKPKDVMCAIVIKSNTRLEDILNEAGDAAREPYKFTPFDFVGRDKSSWILYWTYWINILRNLGIVFASKKRPIDKIPDDLFRDLTTPTTILLFVVPISYAAIHIAGWDFHFPTHVERTIWHVATLATISSITTYWIVDFIMWHGTMWIREVWSKWFGQDSKSMLKNEDIEKGDSRATKRKVSGVSQFAATRLGVILQYPSRETGHLRISRKSTTRYQIFNHVNIHHGDTPCPAQGTGASI